MFRRSYEEYDFSHHSNLSVTCFSDDEDSIGSDDDSDEDIILEAGPALVLKRDDAGGAPGDGNAVASANAETRRDWRAEDLL